MVFTSFKRDIAGNVGMMFALCLLAILAAVGVALDFTLLSKKDAKLQGLTDSIVLAAAVSIKNQESNVSDLDEIARSYLAQAGFSDVQAIWEINASELGLTLQTTHPMVLMGIFGDKEKPLRTVAKVSVNERKDVTVALVLDATLSMQGTKITSLRNAANELIDIVTDTGSNDTYMSVVPFTDIVKIPVSLGDEIWFEKPDDKEASFQVINQDLSENCRVETIGESRKRVCDVTVYTDVNEIIPWHGCTISRDFGFHDEPEYKTQRLQGFARQGYCADDRNTIAPMTKNVTDIKDAVRDMVPHGTTYIPAGLIWGWRTLQEAQPLTQVQHASPGSQKVMVLMTDGANEVSLGESVPWSNGIFHDGDDIDAADMLTAELCQRIKSEDIIIYTVALEVNDVDTISLMRNCATSPTHFYDLSNSAALSNAFNNIGIEVNDIRLSL